MDGNRVACAITLDHDPVIDYAYLDAIGLGVDLFCDTPGRLQQTGCQRHFLVLTLCNRKNNPVIDAGADTEWSRLCPFGLPRRRLDKHIRSCDSSCDGSGQGNRPTVIDCYSGFFCRDRSRVMNITVTAGPDDYQPGPFT